MLADRTDQPAPAATASLADDSRGPMMTRYRLSSASIAALRGRSVSLDAVAEQARLPREFLQGQRIFLTGPQLRAFWDAVDDVSGDPAIGLKLGSDMRVGRLSVESLAALAAPTFRDALRQMAHYTRLTCPEDVQVVARGREAAVELRWQKTSGPESRVLTDICFAWVAAVAHQGSEGTIRPIRVEQVYAGSRRLYEKHFGCAVRTDAPRNALIYRAIDLDRPFDTHNADLLRVLAPQLDAELATHEVGEDTREQVKAALCRSLTGRRLDLGDVARELASSRRTLQRRLAAVGVTFHQLIEEARRDSATHYLVFSSLELAEIAYLLGYRDTSSFVRAFSRWEGMPPGKWRDLHRARALDELSSAFSPDEPGSVSP